MPQNSSSDLPVPKRKPGIHPLPAGQASPPVLRAVEELRRLDPARAYGIIPKEMDWMDPDAFSNTLGAVDNGELNEIQINPGYSMLFPQSQINRTVAHEAQHIRQARNADEHGLKFMQAANRVLPYSERPHEIEAFDYAEQMFPYRLDGQDDPRVGVSVTDALKGLWIRRDKFKSQR